LPSRSPPIQVPNVNGCGERVVQVGEHPRRGVRVQLGQVVDRVARLVGRLRPGQSQLVGLPQQVDQLRQPPVVRGRVGAAAERPLGRLRVQRVGDRALLDQDRPAGRLGRVGGEHRPDREPPDRRVDVRGRGAGLADQLGGLPQPAAGDRAGRPQLAGPVHLLGHVRQVEVGRERAAQLGTGRHVQRGQPLRRGRRVGAHQGADLLDLGEQLAALLPDQCLAEQRAQPPDVRPQRRVRRVGVRLFGHRSSLPMSRVPPTTLSGDRLSQRS
jgi:hypothetical protein